MLIVYAKLDPRRLVVGVAVMLIATSRCTCNSKDRQQAKSVTRLPPLAKVASDTASDALTSHAYRRICLHSMS